MTIMKQKQTHRYRKKNSREVGDTEVQTMYKINKPQEYIQEYMLEHRE